jgi:hypothetical protein
MRRCFQPPSSVGSDVRRRSRPPDGQIPRLMREPGSGSAWLMPPGWGSLGPGMRASSPACSRQKRAFPCLIPVADPST